MPSLVRFSVIAILVAGCLLAQDSQQKEQPPAGGTPKPFVLPSSQTVDLKNGMQVTLVPYGSIPKVTVSVYVRAGNVDELANQVWLADILGELMKEGAGSRTAEQLAQDVARMGGQLNVAVGLDQTEVSADILSEFAADLVSIIADVVQRPTLPGSELPRIRNNKLRQLAVARSNPQQLASEAFRKALYPDHPYGRLFPTEEMIQSYTLEDVQKFYRESFCASRAHLYVVGRFDPGVLKAIREKFEGWAAGEPKSPLAPKPASARSLTVIDRPGAAQSTLRIGLPILGPNISDYIPMVVTNAILGGSFASRITSNIREQKGYSYSPYSQIGVAYHDGHWVQNADVTTAVTGASLKEIFAEIDRMRKDPPTENELQGIKTYLAGTFVLTNSSRRGTINQLAFVDLQGLGTEYLNNYVQKVLAVSGADVQRLAETYLNPAKMAIVVVGDKAKITDQLEPYKVN